MNYWLVKSDPESYSWEQMLKDKSTIWDGVRNYQARNYLSQMKKGDTILFYHSGKEKSIVGIISVIEESIPDPTSSDTSWLAVRVGKPEQLKNTVSFQTIKDNPKLKDMALLKQSRLSVMLLTKIEYDTILKLANAPTK